MFTLIIVLFFFNILCEIKEINPESKIKFNDVKYNEEILLKVPKYKFGDYDSNPENPHAIPFK